MKGYKFGEEVKLITEVTDFLTQFFSVESFISRAIGIEIDQGYLTRRKKKDSASEKPSYDGVSGFPTSSTKFWIRSQVLQKVCN